MDLFATVPETDPSFLNDVRTPADFKTTTFSQYKRTEVKSALLDALRHSKVENSCYWCAELVAAGHYTDLWDVFFLVLGKYGHPLLVQYYRRRFALFRAVIHENERVAPTTPLRNHIVLRQLFAEMAATVALSEKRPSYEEVIITAEDMTAQMMHHLQADRADYALSVEPKELHIAINELCYHVRVTRNMNRACFWIEWLTAFAALCKKKGEPLFCERRTQYEELDRRHQTDPVWLLWEALLTSAQTPLQQQTITALFELFRIRYAGAATIKKRKSMLYFAVSLFTETTVYPSELVTERNKEVIRVATDHINDIYTTLTQYAQKQSSQTQPEETYRHIEKRENFKDSMKKWDVLAQFDHVQQR